jgi:hypothetical protein
MELLPSTAGAQDEPKAHRDIRGLVKRDLGHLDHYHAHEVCRQSEFLFDYITVGDKIYFMDL